MRYDRFHDIDAFRGRTEALLLTHEAEHGLLLSVIASWDRITADAHAGLLIDDDGSVAAVAVRRDWRLLVSRSRSAIAANLLADALRNEPCGRILGASESVEAIVAARARPIARRLAQGIYANRSVVWPNRRPAGRRRVARDADADTLTVWHIALSEAIGEHETHDAARASVAARIAGRALHVWEDDGRIVSSAAAVGPTPHGIRINLVYTPPECRGRGYASCLVADLTQELLDGGRDFVFLHTDLANPTSNALYQRLGFEPAGDFMMVELAPS